MHVDNESQSVLSEALSTKENNSELDERVNEMQDVPQQIAETEVTEEVLSQVTGGFGNLAAAGAIVGGSTLIGAAGGSFVHSDNGPNGRNAGIGAAGGAALGSVAATAFLRRSSGETATHKAVEDAIELITRR